MSDVLKALSLAVDERATEWGEQAWQKGVHAAVPGPSKRRRIDPHVKAWVVQEAVQQGQQHSSSAAANALEPGVGAGQRQWREKEMSCVRAAMHLSFANPQSLSVCWDGMRLGNPAKEYLLAAVSGPGNVHAVLPPQDLCFALIRVRNLCRHVFLGIWFWAVVGKSA